MISSDWMSAYQERRQQEQETAKTSLAKTCDSLVELGVTEVRIAYDGYGDSGTIECVTAMKEEETVELPGEIRSALISSVECLLPDGWPNDAGAFGEFVLQVRHRELTREHNWRVESTEYDEEVWEL